MAAQDHAVARGAVQDRQGQGRPDERLPHAAGQTEGSAMSAALTRLILAAALCCASAAALAHRFHTGITDLSHNDKTGSVEVVHTLMAHDIDALLALRARRQIDVAEPDGEALLRNYIDAHFYLLDADGKRLPLKWVGLTVWLSRASSCTRNWNRRRWRRSPACTTTSWPTSCPTRPTRSMCGLHGRDPFAIVQPQEQRTSPEVAGGGGTGGRKNATLSA
ncbi:hypothetical protein LP420_27610 [Massilia sp. B-10]|nr:hypothetical protein LP420_27610 [Massilia sp. B-10]